LTENERSELARLRKENRGLKAEREFLGKAAAYVGDRCQAVA
jgi:transposase-like protein